MFLPPPIARTLYRSLLSSSRLLQSQLLRYPLLLPREIASLRTACASPLPKDLRGLVDLHHPPPSQTTIPHYISIISRRILEAAQAPDFHGLESRVGFAALRHLNSRVDALRHLVFHTNSDAERFGIRVEVESSYQGSDRDRFFFRYQVRILNASEDTVQLLSRAWTIRDLDGRVTSVEGPGVVGTFPTLAPRETYEYSSAVPLSTPVGTQSGHYVFIVNTGDGIDHNTVNSANGWQNRMRHVPIAPFSYRAASLDKRRGSALIPGSGGAGSGGKGKGRRRRTDDLRKR